MDVGFTALQVVVQVVSEQVNQVYCVVPRVSLEHNCLIGVLSKFKGKNLGVSGEEDKGNVAHSFSSSCIC